MMKGIFAHPPRVMTTESLSSSEQQPQLQIVMPMLPQRQRQKLLASKRRQQQQHEEAEDAPPLLLLEGDELHVSPHGIARSVYELSTDSINTNNTNTKSSPSSWTIEERYNLMDSSKTFVIRESTSNKTSTTITSMIEIQEMDTRVVGTGGTTWESSFAMALYFATHPDELQGNIVELGSGVGLGGILLHHVTHQQHAMTLTDYCPQVVRQCQTNIDRHEQQHGHNHNNKDNDNNNDDDDDGNTNNNNQKLKVIKLDWNDVLQDVRRQQEEHHNNNQKTILYSNYDTVLACDCAYRSRDVPALTETLKALLVKPQQSSLNDNHNDAACPPANFESGRNNKIHLFGPYNRASYHEVIECLERDDNLQVQVEWIELKRYRLAASPNSNNNNNKATATTTMSAGTTRAKGNTNSSLTNTSQGSAHNKDATCVVIQHPYRHHHHEHQQYIYNLRHDNKDEPVADQTGVVVDDDDDDDGGGGNLATELQNASQSTTKFLHVTAYFKSKSQDEVEVNRFSCEGNANKRLRSTSLSDID